MTNLLIELFQNVLVAFLINFLGFGVISLAKIGTKLSFIERLVAGSLISNYVLMIVGIFLGVVFQAFLKEFFILYIAISLLVLIFYLYANLKKLLQWHLPKIDCAPLIVFICFAQLLFIVPALMHPIHNSYDYVYFFGPTVKEIVKANGIPTDIPYAQIRGDFAPGVLLTHVFSEMLVSDSAFRLVSYSHFVLSLLVVYLIARNLLNDRELGIIAVAVMNLMPALFTFFSSYSVYTEVSLMFYIISAVWCIVMGLKTRRDFWYMVAGMSIALILLSKNVGLYGVFIAFSILPLYVNSKKLKILLILFNLTPIFYRLGVNLLINPSISSFYPNLGLIELIPIVLIGSIWSYASIKSATRKSLSFKSVLIPLLFSSMASIWYLRNLIVFGTPTFNLFPNPSMRQAEVFYKAIFSVEKMYPPLQNSLRLDYILTFTYLGSLLIVPKILGFAHVTRYAQNNPDSRKESNWMVVIFPLLSYLLLWLVIFYGAQDSTAVRNGIIVIPFLSLIVAYGLVALFGKIKSKLNLAPTFITLAISLYIIETFAIMLSRPTQLPSITGSENVMSIITLFWALLPPIITFALAFIVSKYLASKILFAPKKLLLKTTRFLMVLIPIASLIFYSPLLSFFVDITKNNLDVSDYQQNVLHIYSTWGEYDLNLIDYFQNEVDDTLAVVGFWTNGLYYFTGHRTFDPNEYPGLADLYDLSAARNATKMLELLKDKGIGYILLPLPNNPYYNRFVRFTYFSPFYDLALDDRYATRLGNFDMFELFKLKQNTEKFLGLLDVRLVLYNDSTVAMSPNMLGNHGENTLPVYVVGKNPRAFLRVTVDLSGMANSSGSQFTINTAATIDDKSAEHELYLTNSSKFPLSNDTIKEIQLGPLIPEATYSIFNLKSIKIEIINEDTNESYTMEAITLNGETAFLYDTEVWSIVQGSSYLQINYIQP